ncbi:hypothetical protein C0J52_19899 [Blattella germanica]|nr:hypothetical protein C0J52_19899 [Blattella germanica]
MDGSNNDSEELFWGDNETSTEGGPGSRDPLCVLVPITVVYAVILLTGLVGNVSTCIVIARNKHMHTATNYYLFSLAISDLLLLVSGLPQEMYFIWFRAYPVVLGEAVCVLQGFSAETSANATVLTITAFTVERYVAICHPFQSHTFSKVQYLVHKSTELLQLSRAVRIIVLIWVFALGLAVPQAILFGLVEDGGTKVVQCTVTSELVQHAFEISTIVFFVTPMTLLSVLYALIGLKLRRSKLLPAAGKRASIGSSGAGAEQRTNCKGHAQNHVIRMLVAVVVAFFICWAPFHAQRLLAMYARNNATSNPSPVLLTVYKTLTYASGVFYYMSTTVNPVLYHIMSHKFREAFKSTLAQPCGFKRKNGNKCRTYSVLKSQQQINRNLTLLRQQSRPCISSAKDLRNAPNIFAAERHHQRAMQSEAVAKHKSDLTEEQNISLIESSKCGGRTIPTDSSVDTITSNSYPMYSYRSRIPSNSSQTTLTTSLGKISLNEGNNNCAPETSLPRTQSRNQSMSLNDCFPKKCIKDPDEAKAKGSTHASTFGVLAKKLRSLPLPGNAKSAIIVPQHKAEADDRCNHRLSSHVSIDSAKSTISNSSLQDLDETEFVGAELAHYMGELNRQRAVR